MASTKIRNEEIQTYNLQKILDETKNIIDQVKKEKILKISLNDDHDEESYLDLIAISQDENNNNLILYYDYARSPEENITLSTFVNSLQKQIFSSEILKGNIFIVPYQLKDQDIKDISKEEIKIVKDLFITPKYALLTSKKNTEKTNAK